MNKKKINIHVYKILKDKGNSIFESYTENELKQVFNNIENNPLDLTNKSHSRYSVPGSNDEKCLIFRNEIIDFNQKFDDGIEPFLFIHRRGNTRPYQENGEGSLVKLQLEDEKFEIAEVAFILIDFKNQILMWNYNPFVGGINKLIEYLNKKNISGKKNEDDNRMNDILTLNHILYPNAYNDFVNKMTFIKNFEFNMTGTPDSLSQLFLDKPDHGRGMSLVRDIAKNSNSAKIKIELTAEKNKKKSPAAKSINKQYVLRFYEDTKDYLISGNSNKFSVQGNVDEDFRLLDLIESKLIYPIKFEYEPPTIPIEMFMNEMNDLLIKRRDEIVRFTK